MQSVKLQNQRFCISPTDYDTAYSCQLRKVYMTVNYDSLHEACSANKLLTAISIK